MQVTATIKNRVGEIGKYFLEKGLNHYFWRRDDKIENTTFYIEKDSPNYYFIKFSESDLEE